MPQLYGINWPELPPAYADGTNQLVRTNKYGEIVAEQRSISGMHGICAEGTYFKAMLPLGTAAITLTGTSQGAFVTTTPTIAIRNGNGAAGKSLFLDYVRINITVAAATTPTRVEGAVTTDSSNRSVSGGSAATIYNANIGSATSSGAAISAGVLTASNVVGTPHSRFTLLNSNPAVGSSLVLTFGANVMSPLSDNASGAVNCGPLELLPNLSATCLIYLWWPGLSAGTAPTGDFEVAYWER